KAPPPLSETPSAEPRTAAPQTPAYTAQNAASAPGTRIADAATCHPCDTRAHCPLLHRDLSHDRPAPDDAPDAARSPLPVLLHTATFLGHTLSSPHPIRKKCRHCPRHPHSPRTELSRHSCNAAHTRETTCRFQGCN